MTGRVETIFSATFRPLFCALTGELAKNPEKSPKKWPVLACFSQGLHGQPCSARSRRCRCMPLIFQALCRWNHPAPNSLRTHKSAVYGHYSDGGTNRGVWDRRDLTIMLARLTRSGFVSQTSFVANEVAKPLQRSPVASFVATFGNVCTSIASSCRPIRAICSSEVWRGGVTGGMGSRLGRCREPRSGADRRPEQ